MMTIAAPAYHLRLLNGFELWVRGDAVPVNTGVQRLVVFLALHRGPLQRSRVAGTLWPDVPADRASANLRASIWRVPASYRALIDISVRHIRLAADVTVDFLTAVARARRLIDRAEDCDENDFSERTRAELSSELLPASYDDWVLLERERFRQLRLHALEALCERLTASGRYGEAIDAGLAAVCAEPLRESSHRVLINAHLAEGNNAEACRQYELYRKVVRDELGAGPSRGLHDRMIQVCGARRCGDLAACRGRGP